MQQTLPFPDLLRLVDDRSAALRAAVAAAPSLDAQVPTCPEWALRDLVQHLGSSHRRWAATVAAGPAQSPPPEAQWASAAPVERPDLLDWSAASTRLLLDALQDAGPDRGCWTWWGPSQSPADAGAVARHQVQHVTVHAYDAQVVAGTAEPLPPEAALDGVDEFLSTCVAWAAPWPHEPAVVDYHATEGGSWRLAFTGSGARACRLTPGGGTSAAATVSLSGTASDLVLAFYGREVVDGLELTGDGRVIDQLIAWEPG